MTATILTDAKAAEVRSRVRQPEGLIAALLSGKTIHFDDDKGHFNAAYLRRQHRVRLRTSSDGNGGRYYWTEPIE